MSDPKADLDALANAIRQRLDSAPELQFTPRSAVAQTKASQSRPVFDPTQQKAALLVSFDPPQLGLSHSVVADSAAATYVTLSSPSGPPRWTLAHDQRVRVLRDLNESGQLISALDVTAGLGTDPAQMDYEQLLRGAPLRMEHADVNRLRAVQRMANWLVEARIPVPVELDELQSRIAWRALLEPFEHIAGSHFRGRVAQLAWIRDFVNGVPEASSAGAGSLALAITGPGGVGKSTLLAQFILTHATARSGGRFAFAYLDFDRPDVDPEQPLAVLAEAVRQLALSHAAVGDRLEDLRRGWLDRMRELTANDSAETRAMRGSLLASAVGATASVLSEARSNRHTVLLVLDTFEEVQYRGNPAVDAQLRMLEQLQSHLPHLRIIIAGRNEIASSRVESLVLGAFDEEAAIAYLEARGIKSRDLCHRIFRQLGGSPLTLKLAAELLMSGGSEEIEAFQDEELFSRLDDEAIQQLLYKRILDHIHDEAIRRLAHPGLVLRRLTPEIIQNVLAEICGFGAIDIAAATALAEGLKREVSLIRSEPDGSLRHREDVRKLMVRLLHVDKPQEARTIHARAIAFYSGSIAAADRAEEIYHRLWLNHLPAKIDPRWLDGVGSHLFHSLDEFDPPRRAYLAARLGVMPDAEARGAASSRVWEELVGREVRQLIKMGRNDEALAVMHERKERTASSPLIELQAEAEVARGDERAAVRILSDALAVRSPLSNRDARVGVVTALVRLALRTNEYDTLDAALDAIRREDRDRQDAVNAVLLKSLRAHVANRRPELWRQDLPDATKIHNAMRRFDKAIEKRPELGCWAATAPGADQHERLILLLKTIDLPRASSVSMRELGLALARADGAHARRTNSPQTLRQNFDVPERGSLLESWVSFAVDAQAPQLTYVLNRFLSKLDAEEKQDVLSAVRQVLEDALGIRAAPRRQEEVAIESETTLVLNDEERHAVVTAFLNAFTLPELDEVLSKRGGIERAAYVSRTRPFFEIVSKLVDAANREGWVDRLIELAVAARPKNGDIARCSRLLRGHVIIPTAFDSIPPLVNPESFAIQLTSLSRMVCLVRANEGQPLGTGLLIGPDLVLTGMHTASDQSLAVTFDFKDPLHPASGLTFKAEVLATDQIGEVGSLRFGYALLKVDGSPGAQPVGQLEFLESAAALRGWFRLDMSTRLPAVGAPLAILQHARGTPLTMGTGRVLSVSPLTYDVPTSPGSSGGPVLDLPSFNLMGIHIGKGGAIGAQYNIGLAASEILASLRRKGLIHLIDDQSVSSSFSVARSSAMPHFSDSPTVSSIFRNRPKLAEQIREIIASGKVRGLEANPEMKTALEAFVDGKPRPGGGLEMAADGPRAAEAVRGLEAIVETIGRPPLLIEQGTYVIPSAVSEVIPQDTLNYINALQRPLINAVIAGSGRVDIVDVPGMPFVGTAWIVDKPKDDTAIMVTNRHVAQEFARADGHGGFSFRTAPNFRPFQPEIGFVREHMNDVFDQKQAKVVRVRYIAADSDPDIALLEVKGEHIRPLMPIVFSDRRPKNDIEIGVVGYPAYDSRNDAGAVARYFNQIFNVKRFAFGEVTGVSTQNPEFTHNATTLGGNSGSCVFELDSGKAIGLHFAGDYRIANYSVHAEQVKRALAGLKTTAVIARPEASEAISDGRKPVSFYEGRDGYDPAFLGAGTKSVALPGLGTKWRSDAASVVDADTGKKASELKYRHFSVVMSKNRKLPLFTAVNINGGKAKRLGRIDKWYVDGRLAEEFQVGNEAYSNNPLDRGHMVRREDPVWGSMEEAQQANVDTFHYTNCSPQHEALNQRDWLSLEDYVLANARTHKLMVSVFTGPILRDDDRFYRDAVQLPEDFWKVIVMLDSVTRKLSATGYVLTQSKLIKRLTEAFVYGAFRTYQVPITLIEIESGLDFSHVTPHDPFALQRKSEGLENTMRNLFNPISSAADIIVA